MSVGISTSCFYPLETESALIRLGELGVDTCEVFINADSELQEGFLKELKAIRENYGMRIKALHPMMSFAEPYTLFSEYERRFHEAVESYKRYFNAANILGAELIVIHGSRNTANIGDNCYFERFGKLACEGKKFGVTVAQENVVHFVSESPDFMSEMKSYLGEDFAAVLDIKQSVRAGVTPFDFIDVLGNSIIHVHVSDHSYEGDCLPPGNGDFDFKRLFSAMGNVGYKGDYIVELYSHNFKSGDELKKAKQYLECI